MKNIKNLYTITAILLVVFMGSCQKDEVIGGTAVQSMSGEWWVECDCTPAGTYFHFSTYNTSANVATEMWLDDLGSFWSADGSVRGKVTVDLPTLSFSGTDIANADDNVPITFTITNGKVIKNGTKGISSKAVTDSIYFQAVFSDDPTNTYTLSGYRRTGFVEDDH